MKIKEYVIGSLIVFFSIVIVNAQMNSKIKQGNDYVPDKETAVKIAEAIWLPIYGDKIFKNRPFDAELRNDSVWVVQGTLKTGKGGVPYIEIRKADCKILKVTHGK